MLCNILTFTSKAQYETQFRRWGFRKKLTSAAWHSIGHAIEHRKIAGLGGHVYFYDERICSAKVKKETARYRICGTNKTSCSADSLPEGVFIRDVVLPVDSEQVSSVSPPSTEHSLDHLSPDTFSAVSPYLCASAPSSVTALATSLELEDFPSRLPTPNLHFEHGAFELILGYDRLDDTWATTSNVLGNRFPMTTIALFEDVWNPLLDNLADACLSWSRGRTKVLDYGPVKTCIDRTMALLPWGAQQDLTTRSNNIVLFRQIMFLLMNNFAGSDYAPFEALFQRLNDFSTSQMEAILDAIPSPYSQALQQSILAISIKSGVTAIVKVLLSRGLDIHRVTCRFAGMSYTPLGLACKFRHMAIVQLLVDFGVDVNQRDQHTTYTALWHLLGFEFNTLYDSPSGQLPPVTCDILRLLLMAGARVSWNELENIHFWTNLPLLEVYMRYGKCTLFQYGYQIHRPLRHATHVLEPAKATRAIRVMLGESFKAGGSADPAIDKRCVEVLEGASLQGNLSLIEFFLERGFEPTVRSLSQAVRGNSMLVVQRFLAAGLDLDIVLTPSQGQSESERPYAGTLPPDVDVLLHEEIIIRYSTTTPFAEAVRWRRFGMIQLFLDNNIYATITESSRFSAALIAAAEAGNLHITRLLLDCAKTHPELLIPALSVAVSLATLGSHIEIVEVLMAAGIQPVPASITSAIVVRNADLVRLYLDTGIPVDIPGLVWFAVRWGNLPILNDLIAAGAPINEMGWRLEFMETNVLMKDVVRSPLSEAIKKGDAGVIQLLLDAGANVSMEIRSDLSGQKGLSPLAVAVQCGHEDLTAKLLNCGANPYDPAALLAASLHSTRLTQRLLDAFNTRYPEGKKYFASKALRRAIRDDNDHLVHILAAFTDPNDIEQRREEPDEVAVSKGRSLTYLPSPLGEAIISRNKNIIDSILRLSGDPNCIVATYAPIPHKGRWTALLQAVGTGDLEIVKLIREAGANVNCKTTRGMTRSPLQLAVELGHCDIVKYLLEEGADVNEAPCIWEGGTAFQLAAIKGYVGVAELLLQHGADLNAPRCKFQGRTAFEGAAEHGRMDMLLLLYHKGVDIVTDGGEQVQRAIEFAERNGQLAAKSLVEQLMNSVRSDAVLSL
jgi:ankyrin repeat protein